MAKDFGDILDKWEHGKNTAQDWFKNIEVFDKDKDTHARENTSPDYQRSRLRNSQPDDIIDIHGLSAEKAQTALEFFFKKAKSSGCKKLRIIHGKGNHSQGEAVLKKLVRKFIEECPFSGESGYEKAVNGGSGATWVLLK